MKASLALFSLVTIESFLSSFQLYTILSTFLFLIVTLLLLGFNLSFLLPVLLTLLFLHGAVSCKHVVEDYVFDTKIRAFCVLLLNVVLLRVFCYYFVSF